MTGHTAPAQDPRDPAARPIARHRAGVRGVPVLALAVFLAATLAAPAAGSSQPAHSAPPIRLAPPSQPGLLGRPGLPIGLGQAGVWERRAPLGPGFPAGLWRPGLASPGAPGPGPAIGTPTGGPAAPAAPAAVPAAPGTPWHVSPAVNPAAANGALAAISCPAAAACVAAGDYLGPAGIQLPLAERWNGSRWLRQAVPAPPGAIWARLSGVSCTSASACTAVGDYLNAARLAQPLAERWDGTRWRRQPVPSPAGNPQSGLFAVSCAAARACNAVGATSSATGQTTALAESWDGSRWTVQAAATPPGSQGSELLAVSCTAPRACTAAGSYADATGQASTLAERSAGANWHIQPTPNPAGSAGAGISGVSCATPADCIAAGSYSTGSGGSVLLAERWNGSSWSIQPAPSPPGATGGEFLAVSCAAAAACTATGAYATTSEPVPLAERWNGTRWLVQPTPAPAGAAASGFAAVSCPAPAGCTAAGSYATAGFVSRTLAQVWHAAHGGRWRIQPSPSPRGAAVSAGFDGVSCQPVTGCTAVGFRVTPAGPNLTLAEVERGGRWRIQVTPSPPGTSDAILTSISCLRDGSCTAVGEYQTTASVSVPLAEARAGGRWHIQPMPVPAGASAGSYLAGVSCATARACAAVGYYFDQAGNSVPFAQTWDGSRWRLETVPNPSGAVSHLFAVSCTGPRACTAIGDDGAEVWNGQAWRFQPVAAPPGAQAVLLSAVSCTAASACTAAGSYFSSTTGPLTLAERWDGTAWRIQPTPSPIPAGRNQFNAVSCASARACTAVGYDAQSDFAPPMAIAETWRGAGWQPQPVPVPGGAVPSDLGGLSCTAAGACTAVGTWANVLGISYPLAVATSG